MIQYNAYPRNTAVPYTYPKYGMPGAAAANLPPTMPSGTMIPGAYMPAPTAAPTFAPTAAPTPPGVLPLELSYIENILRLNLGKMATIYMTFENNSQWNAKVFKGRLEAAGRDHIIISDPITQMRYLLLMVNLDYITFEEELQYVYPYGAAPLPAAGR